MNSAICFKKGVKRSKNGQIFLIFLPYSSKTSRECNRTWRRIPKVSPEQPTHGDQDAKHCGEPLDIELRNVKKRRKGKKG